jgi:hypothetical protein
VGDALPALTLQQNFPNPFSLDHHRVRASARGRVSLRVYAVNGALVRTLVDGVEAAVACVTWMAATTWPARRRRVPASHRRGGATGASRWPSQVGDTRTRLISVSYSEYSAASTSLCSVAPEVHA